MFVSSVQELIQAVKSNQRVTYVKNSSRFGWEGKLSRIVNNQKVEVIYDNDIVQEYAFDAFISSEFTSAYIEVGKPTVSHECLVVTTSGEIFHTKPTIGEAIEVASEAVANSGKHEKMHIYKKAYTIQPKPVELLMIEH